MNRFADNNNGAIILINAIITATTGEKTNKMTGMALFKLRGTYLKAKSNNPVKQHLRKLNYRSENNFLLQEIYQYLYDRISWRFCGGFFLGDKESLLHFFEKFKFFWVLYLSKNKITWEVNIWHYMEFLGLLNTLWYNSSHDEGMVKIPDSCFQS